MIDTSIYWNINKLLDRSQVLYYFVLGERGTGKTYSAIKYAIKDFIKNGNQFVYLRRYKSELKTAVPHFFDPYIVNNEFEGHDLEVKKNGFYVDGELAGYPIALSTANILKSTSFPQVATIIFDEFCLLGHSAYHYLGNEVTQFLELYETISRLRTVKVFFLGNSISVSNPYFVYFGLDLPYNSEFRLFKNGLICVNYIKNQKYRDEKEKTPFGRLIKGTEYGEYAIDNKMLQDSGSFIKKKSGLSRNWYNICLNGTTYGIWVDKDNQVYISLDYDPNNPKFFSLDTEDHNDETILIARKSAYISNLLEIYSNAKLAFESQQIKNAFLPLIEKSLIL